MLKRDSKTRQCSEERHYPSGLTQCQCLVVMKSEWEREEEAKTTNNFGACCEIIRIFNFHLILNKHWIWRDEKSDLLIFGVF